MQRGTIQVITVCMVSGLVSMWPHSFSPNCFYACSHKNMLILSFTICTDLIGMYVLDIPLRLYLWPQLNSILKKIIKSYSLQVTMLGCMSKSSSNLHGAYKLYMYLGEVGLRRQIRPQLDKDVQGSMLLASPGLGKSFLHPPCTVLP